MNKQQQQQQQLASQCDKKLSLLASSHRQQPINNNSSHHNGIKSYHCWRLHICNNQSTTTTAAAANAALNKKRSLLVLGLRKMSFLMSALISIEGRLDRHLIYQKTQSNFLQREWYSNLAQKMMVRRSCKECAPKVNTINVDVVGDVTLMATIECNLGIISNTITTYIQFAICTTSYFA